MYKIQDGLMFICVSLGTVQSQTHNKHQIMVWKGGKGGEREESERLGKEREEGRAGKMRKRHHSAKLQSCVLFLVEVSVLAVTSSINS